MFVNDREGIAVRTTADLRGIELLRHELLHESEVAVVVGVMECIEHITLDSWRLTNEIIRRAASAVPDNQQQREKGNRRVGYLETVGRHAVHEKIASIRQWLEDLLNQSLLTLGKARPVFRRRQLVQQLPKGQIAPAPPLVRFRILGIKAGHQVIAEHFGGVMNTEDDPLRVVKLVIYLAQLREVQQRMSQGVPQVSPEAEYIFDVPFRNIGRLYHQVSIFARRAGACRNAPA